jgi:L-lactate utilization protein LutB
VAVVLPAITLTDEQFQRVRAVIPGATNAEKAAEYERMVRAMLRRLVIDADVRAATLAAEATVAATRVAAAEDPTNP